MELLADVLAHFAPQGIGRVRPQTEHEMGEQGTDQIQPDQQQQYLADGGKVNAAGALHLAHDAGENLGGGVAQHLGAKDGDGGAEDGQEGGHAQLDAPGFQGA